MAAPPVPSSSNNWPRGWILRSNSSQNFALMVDTCAPESTKAVTLHPSTTTGASLARPTNCTTRSGFRNGMDSMFFCPFVFLPLSGSVVARGYRGNVLFLLCVIGGGFDCISLGPLPCLMVPQELHISLAIWPQP